MVPVHAGRTSLWAAHACEGAECCTPRIRGYAVVSRSPMSTWATLPLARKSKVAVCSRSLRACLHEPGGFLFGGAPILFGATLVPRSPPDV